MQDTNTEVLQSVFTSAETGSESIADLLPRVNNPALKQELERHRRAYQSLGAQAEKRLRDMGRDPREPGSMQKLGMKLGIEMQTAVNRSGSHIAELMINGSNMGIINLTKIRNSYRSADADALALCDRFIEAERQNIGRMKPFLQ